MPAVTSRPPAAGTQATAAAGNNSILIVGLGNPLVSDDAVGLHVADSLRSALGAVDDLCVEQDYWGGLRLMERMIGYAHAIVVDAMCCGGEPGTVKCFDLKQVATQKSGSAHDVDLATALAFGRLAGASLPADDDVYLVGIEAADVINFSNQCSPAVAAAIPEAVSVVSRLVDSIRGAQST